MAAPSQDRRTRMVHSSVHAPPKKDGAGGKYTWGAATDVMDYAPVGLGTTPVGVMTDVQPMAPQMAPQAPFQANITDSQQFPTLGGAPVAPGARPWGPGQGVVQAPRQMQWQMPPNFNPAMLQNPQHLQPYAAAFNAPPPQQGLPTLRAETAARSQHMHQGSVPTHAYRNQPQQTYVIQQPMKR
eukprot:CAMPEP_0170593032 /NCGR_PEP_ID=MMETSP0224-20130122/13230_1 /TAXON_ID=285029 /ORGANISM="Togula jolla, Strain CCCM 725" /LENGTH=183 /DNA_ID=CAMNT_0010916955 /DNA_START=76 /DNA_END=627 /DNA_ORIENTATION=+